MKSLGSRKKVVGLAGLHDVFNPPTGNNTVGSDDRRRSRETSSPLRV